MVSTAPPRDRASRSARSPILAVREQRAEATRFRRSLTLVGLTVVAPGSAQLMTGNRRIGKIAVLVWASVVVTGALVLWLVPVDQLVRLAVRPWILNGFTLLVVGLALAWTALLFDAWRLGGPPRLNRRHRLIMVFTTLFLIATVSTPLIVMARYAVAARDAVVTLFPTGEAAATSNGRLNILLLGADAAEGRDGVRPDSINVVSVDVGSGNPVLISLPRNLEKARFAEGSPAAAEFPAGFAGTGDRTAWMLNATWTYGEGHPDMFPGAAGPGLTAVKHAVEGTLGLPIHYYVVIDLAGFRNLVDALGGVTIRITEPLPIGQDGRILEPGLRRLDGYETLWYARSRSDSSDYGRMSRQRCVLGALLHEADPATVLRHFTDIANASTSVVRTDIPQGQLPELIELALQAKDRPVASLQLVPPLIVPADPDFAAIRENVDRAVAASADGGKQQNEATPAGTVPSATTEVGDDGGPTATADSEQGVEESAGQPTVDLSSVCAYE